MTTEQANQLKFIYDNVDSVIDSKSNACYLLGTFNIGETKTISVTSIAGYKNFTVDNFLVSPSSLKVRLNGPNLTSSVSITKTYTASTGTLVVKCPACTTNVYNCNDIAFKAYVENMVGSIWVYTGTI